MLFKNIDWKKKILQIYMLKYFSAILQYLRRAENEKQRVGAISLGALFGLLLGIRKKIFKKTLYAATGGLAAAAVCYPAEAKEYAGIIYSDLKEILQDCYTLFQGGKC